MEDRIKNKLNYLCEMQEKYNRLNHITKFKYDWRERDIIVQIEALENVLNNVLNEWDECYEEDLKEANIK
jgi:hypothetical protein